jgi:hypothetical protein
MRVIAENAGKEGGVVIGNLLEKHGGEFAMYVLARFMSAHTIYQFDRRLIRLLFVGDMTPPKTSL